MHYICRQKLNRMRSLIAIFTLATVSLILQGQGIDFFSGTWQEALDKAKNEDKIVFLDAYAAWCGPCKRMANTVFPDERVGEFFNKNFVSVQIDWEKGEGLTLRNQYKVAAYPTLFFIAPDGKVVHKVVGALEADQLVSQGNKAVSMSDNSETYADAYNKGDRSPELILKYVRSLNKAGKPSLKVANEYLKTQKDLSTDFNRLFILEATMEADSRIFNLLLEHRKGIEQLTSKEEVAEKISKACQNTVKKAIEFQSTELLAEAQAKLTESLPEKGEALALEAEMMYYLELKDAEKYIAAAKTFVKKEAGKDGKKLGRIAAAIAIDFALEEKAMKAAEGFAKDAVKLDPGRTNYLVLAKVLHLNGKSDEALKAADKAMELAKEEGGIAPRQTEMYIQQLKMK